jgi:hypothetical protein
LSLLAPCYPWWRYPVKPPKPRPLDHTKLRREIYPVCRFSKAECAAYVPEKAKEGHKGRLRERHHGDLWTKRAKRDEARKLVLPGTWTFLGADLPINERWKFTPVPKRKAKLVPPVFKGCLVHFQRWKPDRHYYFGAWEQYRFVRWTRTPRPSMPICAIF